MKNYRGIKEAHAAFNFPGSYRTGTIIKNGLVIRIYSNSVSKPDHFTKAGNFYYYLKTPVIRMAFRESRKQGLEIHVFTRNLELNVVEYHGTMSVKEFRGDYVVLER